MPTLQGKVDTYLQEVPGTRTRAAIRALITQLLVPTQNPPGHQPIVISAATTTGVTVSAATTTAVLLSGATTTQISVTGAFTTGLSIAADGTTAISVTSAFTGTTGLLFAGTATNGISITGACTTAISITGATTNGVSITSTTATEDILIAKTSTATTGAIRSMTITQTMSTAATASQVEAFKVALVANAKTGAWAQAIFAQTDFATNGLAHGSGSAICAELSLPASSVVRGTYYVWQSEIDCPTNCVMNANPIGVMSVSLWGGAKTQFDSVGLMFDFSGMTSGTGSFLYTNSIKMRVLGATKYLVYGDAEQGLHLGTSASPNTLVASTPYLSVYTTSSVTTGSLPSVTIQQTMTGVATANQVEALQVKLISNVKTGAWAQAIFAQTDYSTNGLAHGAGSVICAELSLPASSVSRGTYYVWQSEIDCPTNCVMNANPIGVMSISVWGGAKTQFDDVGLLFDISGVTSGAGKFYYDNTANAADAFLKCRVNGATYYIALSDDQSWA